MYDGEKNNMMHILRRSTDLNVFLLVYKRSPTSKNRSSLRPIHRSHSVVCHHSTKIRVLKNHQVLIDLCQTESKALGPVHKLAYYT